MQQEFRELRKCQGWDRLGKFGKAQIDGRMKLILTPAKGLDALIEHEGVKGEISGISLFMKFPDLIEADFSEQIELKKEEIKADGG